MFKLRNGPVICIILGVSPAPENKTVEAEIIEWGTDKDIYSPGEQAKVWITIKNTGDKIINDVHVRGSIAKEIMGRFVNLINQELNLTGFTIKPGETQIYRQSPYIPGFPGRYQITATVVVNGKEAGRFQKVITIQRR